VVTDSPVFANTGNGKTTFACCVGRFFSKRIRISLGKKDQFFLQGEISLTKIVGREQNHLPQKFGPVHENAGAAATKRR
jgi:hypothetical protein